MPKITGTLTSVLCSVFLAASMGALLFPGSSLADAPGDMDDPFFAMEAVEEEELASARGGAVLPNGMTIEVTGLMRVMVDGQHLTTSTFGDFQPGVADIGGMQPMLDGPASVINSLNGISLDQYREINFYISNLPTSLERAPFVPRPDVSQSLRP
jgi:hypothetical protein